MRLESLDVSEGEGMRRDLSGIVSVRLSVCLSCVCV